MSMMKRMSIIKAFILIIVAISVTCKSYAATPIDLGTWSVVQYELNDQPDANWVLSNGNTQADQTVNADASILLGDFDITDRVIDGTWRVNESADDDFIGFVFGYQGRGQYYLFDWKQFDQQDFLRGIFAEKGMSLKIVNVPGGGDPTAADLWPTVGTGNVSVIQHNTIGWKDFTDYSFHLEFNNGFFVIEISEDGSVLQRWEISDNTFTSGFFGFYNYSQGSVVYKGFTEKICNYSVSPASQSFTASGGTEVVSITAGPDACDWTAVSNDTWITITSASTGIGNGSINYSVSEKLSTGSRTGTITIAGETFTVTQDGAVSPVCTFGIIPTSQTFASAGGTDSVSVTATPGSCNWTAISNASWITVTSGSTGTGNGSVGYSVSENTSVVSRTGTITIAEQTFTVTQGGKTTPACTFSITPTNQTFATAGGTDSVNVTATPGSCSWTAISSASWITVTSGGTGNGNGNVNYSVSENTSVVSRTGTMTIAGETFTVTQVGVGPDIKANNSDGPVTPLVNLSVTVAFDPGTMSGVPVDWWLAAEIPTIGWFYYNVSTLEWVFAGPSAFDLIVTLQGPLFEISPPSEVLNIAVSVLPPGTSKFYFAYDTDMNGVLDLDKIVYDLVEVVKP